MRLLPAALVLLAVPSCKEAVFGDGGDDSGNATVGVGGSTGASWWGSGGYAGAGGSGGEAGSGGAQVASSSGQGAGGSGGQGTGGAEPDAGPDAPACDASGSCDENPPGSCAPVDDGCGGAVDCEGSCGETIGGYGLSCDGPTKTCVCEDASGWGVAVEACVGKGAPMFCGDADGKHTPPKCTSTGVLSGSTELSRVWCCA